MDAATKAYKLFPAKFLENLNAYINYFLGDYQSKKLEAYQKYMTVRDATYLHWAIDCVLHWQQDQSEEGIVHIHGTKDEVFPIKHINNCIEIENGTHAMILIKAKLITNQIQKLLIC